MAFEPGGRADKLGNQYESRWVLKQLLRLLNEDIVGVTLEAVGYDEPGVDLWVTGNDGVRQAQQCRARNKSKESWSVSDLSNRGILSAMRRHLDRDDTSEFALVSAIPMFLLGDICDSARLSAGDSEEFFRHQIEAVGVTKTKAFEQFCTYLGINGREANGRAEAFKYLRRTRFILWPADQSSYHDLLERAGMLATGTPKMLLTSLADYAQSSLGKTMTAANVWQHLLPLGSYPRKLTHDARVAPAVEDLQVEFESSIAPWLVAGNLISRIETKKVLEGLETEGVVVLHGAAGYGKTGIIYELTQLLRQRGHSFIPIRLDRKTPSRSTRQFGEDLGLPESPARCLEALAGENTAVLLLDQLDALRWTGAHSTDALDVCKSLVREVRTLRDCGKAVGVVLACRTFDLEHDPEIREWLKESSGQTCRRIEVEALPEETIRHVVESCGSELDSMSAREAHVLRSPLHLAIWADLIRRGKVGTFQTAAQLMRSFWANRQEELTKAGVQADEASAVIDTLVNYLQQEGKGSAPCSLVEGRPHAVQAMHSLGILQTTRSQITFRHQSYLDFCIAARLLKEIYQGTGTVLDWLGQKSQQSLFRREQLRQVLSLLAVESPKDFLESVGEILAAQNVRFHLKHLVLELVGQVEEPDATLLSFLRGLLYDSNWRAHVVEGVLVGHRQYIEWLSSEGLLEGWLDSHQVTDVTTATLLLRSVAEKAGDFSADVLEKFASRDQGWAERALNCLCWKEQDDSDRMFELRLHLARRGIAKDWVDWSHLAMSHPLRALRLLEAIVSKWTVEDFCDYALGSASRQIGHSHLRRWSNQDHQALAKATEEHFAYAWDALSPHIVRLTAFVDRGSINFSAWQEAGTHAEGYVGAAGGIVKLTVEAGRNYARKNGATFLLRIRPLMESKSPITQYVLAETLVALPAEHAEEVLNWLMSDSALLSLGSGRKEPEWMPATRLISAHSPYCSPALFTQLESWLIHYHDPDEFKMAQWRCGGWREGRFPDFWGRAQYSLLPALCPHRRSKQTVDLMHVLARKFSNMEKWQFTLDGQVTGGFVGSPLSRKKLERISNTSWLQIVSNNDILVGHGQRITQVAPDMVAESSVFTFSRDLARVAKRFPERFGRLALDFPADVRPEYIDAIMQGLRESTPEEVPEPEKPGWKAASAALVEAFLAKFSVGKRDAEASTFCWLLHDRADEEWSSGVIAKLIHHATEHCDPAPGHLNIWASRERGDVEDATVEGLLENALNCVRGVGALAVGELLRHHKDWLGRLRPCLGRLISDPHPAVRTAAIEACLPVLDIDREQALAWFSAATASDLRVAASRAGVYFFNCGFPAHQELLSPIIRKMLASKYEDVMQEGAEEVTARWLFHRLFESELTACCEGPVPQRRGVAQVASHFLLDPEYVSRCQALLLPLYNDEDATVRGEARHAFFGEQVLSLPNAPEIVTPYIKSKAYADDPSPLMWSLKEHPGSLIPYAEMLLMICRVFSSSLRDDSRDAGSIVASCTPIIGPILLRLYEQAQGQGDRDLSARCLDTWDLLFENRVGTTRDLVRTMER